MVQCMVTPNSNTNTVRPCGVPADLDDTDLIKQTNLYDVTPLLAQLHHDHARALALELSTDLELGAAPSPPLLANSCTSKDGHGVAAETCARLGMTDEFGQRLLRSF